MGCCDSVPKSSRPDPPAIEYQRNPAKSGLPELLQFKATRNWSELALHITSEERFDPALVVLPSSLALQPQTLGDLALLFLCIGPEASIQAELAIQMCCDLITNLACGTPISQEYSLAYLELALQQESIILVKTLLALDVFKTLVALLRSDTAQVRMLAASVAAAIYRGRQEAQRAFLLHNGHTELVQLISREGDEDEALNQLLECVLDLVTVRFTQDAEGYSVKVHLEHVKKTGLVDIMKCLNIPCRSKEVIVTYDSLQQLWPDLKVSVGSHVLD